MKDENPRPGQEPAPPARTDWSGTEEVEEELAPPFVPGTSRPTEPGPMTGGGKAAQAGDAGEGGGEGFPSEGEWSQPERETREEDDFPFAAFQIEGSGEPSATTHGSQEAMGPAHQLADRLEAMARRLREQGSAAAESEMSSDDRFTALLAGLLAGYLAGR